VGNLLCVERQSGDERRQAGTLQGGEPGNRFLYPVGQIFESKTLDLRLPPGGIPVPAGDLLRDENRAEALADLNDWLGALPDKQRVVIAGNHELLFALQAARARTPLTHAV
jgi:hypothetical protein